MTVEEKIKELKIILPDPKDPVGAYLATRKAGNFLFISGQISIDADGKLIKGKIVYNEKPEFMVKNYNKMLDLGVSILGGCCGTNKLHIKEFRKMIDSNN